jgi:hypothetical protein
MNATSDAASSTHSSNRLNTVIAFLEERPFAVLSVFTLLYALGYGSFAATRMMWTDELWTFSLASAPDFRTILHAIEDGMELNPPLSFFLAHISQAAFGATELATRLPSVIGFWIMCIALFLFMRPRVGTLCAYVAMLLPFFTLAQEHVAEARAYSMVLGAGAAALLFWQKSQEPGSRRWALPGLALACAALVTLHYYALYVVLVIALAEAARQLQRRSLDVWFWLAIVLGCSPLAYLIPIMKKLHANAGHFLLTPSTSALGDVYADLVGPAAIVILIVIAVGSRAGTTVDAAPAEESANSGLQPHEWLAGALLTLMPAAAYAASVAVTNAFMPRYVLPVVLGPAILVPAFLKHAGRASPVLPATAACVLFLFFSGTQLINIISWKHRLWMPAATPTSVVQAPSLAKIRPDLPVVVDNDNEFLQIAHYNPAMRGQVYFLTDTQLEIKHVGFDTVGRTMQVGRRLHPLNVVDYREFVQQHKQFFFLKDSSKMLGWLPLELLEEGADMKLVQFEKQHGFQGSESSLYFVTMPEPSGPNAPGTGLKPDAH